MKANEHIPLPERRRPKTVSEFFGQEKIFGEGSFLRGALSSKRIPSLLLWGPPGSGKTTLARLLANELEAEFVQLSAVESGKKMLQDVVRRALESSKEGKTTLLFVDEIHRWNKAQQDALLPFVENGTLTLIGATTENPSFSVNAALLSRTRVLVLERLSTESIVHILKRAIEEDEILREMGAKVAEGGIEFLAEASGGDARQALSALEACSLRSADISIALIEEVMARSHLLYDKKGEWHYDVISAFHKSLRGGDANAALYWLGRMLEAGEDPLYVARRMIRFASEDVGLANSFALPQAVAAYQACQSIGMPECELALAQAAVYLAKSKKSNALYVGYGVVKEDVSAAPNEPVPLHLRNAPTKLMKNIGYGKGYKYTPDFKNPEDAVQEYFPDRLRGRKYIDFGDKKESFPSES